MRQLLKITPIHLHAEEMGGCHRRIASAVKHQRGAIRRPSEVAAFGDHWETAHYRLGVRAICSRDTHAASSRVCTTTKVERDFGCIWRPTRVGCKPTTAIRQCDGSATYGWNHVDLAG